MPTVGRGAAYASVDIAVAAGAPPVVIIETSGLAMAAAAAGVAGTVATAVHLPVLPPQLGSGIRIGGGE